MPHSQNLEVKLGFDIIKTHLAQNCKSELGKGHVDKLGFSSNFNSVNKLLQETFELKSLLQHGMGFPALQFTDCTAILSKLKISGYFLEEEEFSELKRLMSSSEAVFVFFNKQEVQIYPFLYKLNQRAFEYTSNLGWAHVIKEIDKVIDEKGKVRDHASTELANIRKKLAAEIRDVQKNLDKIYRTAKNSGWIAEDMTLSVRNGRLVIPILAEFKRRMGGFVHDESASGQIAFVEPAEVLESNNEIRDLELRERREVIKILTELSATLQPQAEPLEKSLAYLGMLDFISAKALFAIKIEANLPVLSPNPEIDWTKAVHPLLFLSLTAQGKKVIPLDININSTKRILVVSGPNAGGKSVMLKTIGLTQYMLQCGLLAPVSVDSKMGIFSGIFIDIGDEQSIENDLSTYSSHLSSMSELIKLANSKTLFLIDEFGSGTEPNLGGAIAESILEELVETEAFGVINTHYTNLKVLADKHSNMLNCAMKFDADTLSPLFIFTMGQPGSSYAFEVAEKIGLPKRILTKAKTKVSSSQLNFEKLLAELDSEKTYLKEVNASLLTDSKELKDKIKQYNNLKEFLDTEQKSILNKAKIDAKDLLNQTNKTIEKTIKEIKEGKAEKEKTVEIRTQLDNFKKEKLNIEPVKPKQELILEKDDSEWKIGDMVRLIGQETYGQIMNFSGNEVEVAIGQLSSKIKKNRLEKVSKKQIKELGKEKIAPRITGVNLNEKMSNFSFNLDIRGKRGDEAIIEVNTFMDDVVMLGYPSVRIVHGKGDGILRTLVRNHLKSFKQVRKIADEHPDRGGQGITLVEMF